MPCHRRLTAALLALLGSASSASPQTLGAPWDSVARILKTSGSLTAGYYRYGFPRRDLTLRVGDVTVAPALALGGWAGFSGSAGDALLMGDLVLTGDELAPVQEELARQHIGVSAIHNHVVGDPQISYVHIHAQGDPLVLAAGLAKALARSKLPLPVASSPATPVTIDTVTVFRILGVPGRAQGAVAQFSLTLVPGKVMLHGREVPPALGLNTPINIQAVSATRAVATGDFAILADRVDPVLQALAGHHIAATALHTHLVGEEPKVYYIHFWADAPFLEVLSGLRAALDAAR